MFTQIQITMKSSTNVQDWVDFKVSQRRALWFYPLTYFSFFEALDIYILEIRSTCFRISFKNVFANFLLFLREISKLVKKIVNIWIYNAEYQR